MPIYVLTGPPGWAVALILWVVFFEAEYEGADPHPVTMNQGKDSSRVLHRGDF